MMRSNIDRRRGNPAILRGRVRIDRGIRGQIMTTLCNNRSRLRHPPRDIP
jgi:hypothetical protein